MHAHFYESHLICAGLGSTATTMTQSTQTNPVQIDMHEEQRKHATAAPVPFLRGLGPVDTRSATQASQETNLISAVQLSTTMVHAPLYHPCVYTLSLPVHLRDNIEITSFQHDEGGVTSMMVQATGGVSFEAVHSHLPIDSSWADVDEKRPATSTTLPAWPCQLTR